MWRASGVFIIYVKLLIMAKGETENFAYRFDVYPVNECPMNKTAFEKAAKKMNCTGRYLCAPNKDLRNLLEFCTDRTRSLYGEGNCVRLEGTGDLNHYNCSNFTSGCPKTPYFDEEIYMNPACLKINTDFQCYVFEKACPVSINMKNDSKKETFNSVVIAYFLVLVVLVIVFILYLLRKKICKDKNVTDEIDKDTLRRFLQEKKITICHARCILVGCAGAGKTTLLRRLEGATFKQLNDLKETELLDVYVNDFEVVKEKNTIKHVKGSSITQTITFSENEIINNKGGNTPNKETPQLNRYEDQENLPLLDTNELPIIEEDAVKTDVQNAADYALADISEMESKTKDNTNNATGIDIPKSVESPHVDITEAKTETSDSGEPKNIIPNETLHKENNTWISYKDVLQFITKRQENARITFVDFAGQDIYYAFHQIYLSPKAGYILVLDMTKRFDEREPKSLQKDVTRFETWTYKDYCMFWLKSIDSFSDTESPVIVVGTHEDKISPEESKAFLHEFDRLLEGRDDLRRHIHSKNIFRVGFPKKTPHLDDLHDIKKSIADIVQKLPLWKEDIDPKWAIFEHLLEKKIKDKIISRGKLLEYNSKLDCDFKLPEYEVTDVLKYLNRIGTILYDDEDENVRNTVILDVQWFVKAFKCIIIDPVDTDKPTDIARRNFHETGELEDNQLDTIWKKYTDMAYLEHKQEIISYMENLGLLAVCEESKESNWYYFPSLNKKIFDKEQGPPKDFVPSSILCFQFDEKKQLPLYVFYALVSKCNKMNGWAILVFSPPESKAENINKIRVEIQTSLERKIRKFKRYTYDVGYKCQKGRLFDENDNSFVSLENFPTTELLCSKCGLSSKHLVDNSICWIKTGDQDNADSQLEFENSKEVTDEGLVSLQHIFRDSLDGNIENFTFHLEKEIDQRKHLLSIVTVNGWNIMHCAAKGGNSKIFEIIASKLNSEMNSKTYDKMTVLHIASKYGRYNICKRILDDKDLSILNETSTHGKNACHFAAEGGSIDVLELLIDKGANAKATTNMGQNIFHIACIYSQLEVCRYIAALEKFHSLLLAEDRECWNATLHAAKIGDERVLNFLREENISFNHKSDTERTALHVACDNGNFNACKFILDVCPSLLNAIDQKGRHAGHFAVRSGSMEILQYLEEKKMNVRKDTNDGMNILHMACLHCHIEMCRYILKMYPNLNEKKTDKGWTAAHFVAGRGIKNGNEKEIFQALLNADSKVDIKLLTKKGNSVLTLAIKYNNHNFAEYLLQYHSELLKIPKGNDPRKTGNEDLKMKEVLDRFLP